MEGLLTKPTTYNIEDSNIALLGSDLEHNVREHAGDGEPAWELAGKEPGLKIWRIEKFHVVDWPKERYGSFYDGDSYIVLHTFKASPDAEDLSYDLHFWLGDNTSQDEAATAAYKTVELDDHLHGAPIQYREVDGYESTKFLSYFPRFLSLKGGVATGFHHVEAAPPDNTKRLYRVTATGTRLVVREVPAEGRSLVPGDAYVLDMGSNVWQLNSKGSVGKERFKAAEFVASLTNERQGACEVTVFDDGTSGVGKFLSALGIETMPTVPQQDTVPAAYPAALYKLSDSTGAIEFIPVELSRSSLQSEDAFLLDDSANVVAPAVYVWIGRGSSMRERRLALQYAQQYLYKHQAGSRARLAVNLVKMVEGRETEGLSRALGE
ncbi:hypothetical protein QCA50_006804 [Cerrena zonata]|uniref:Gelsolin-like domain-containing protein n=1 Tax=Cerrena zonata TaxID=2478898 RepID=A0AAW0GG42_9APHY